jgi:hypothetical protein
VVTGLLQVTVKRLWTWLVTLVGPVVAWCIVVALVIVAWEAARHHVYEKGYLLGVERQQGLNNTQISSLKTFNDDLTKQLATANASIAILKQQLAAATTPPPAVAPTPPPPPATKVKAIVKATPIDKPKPYWPFQ